MTTEIESYIARNVQWDKLPIIIKQLLGSSQREYEKQVFDYSIKTQLKYKDNIVRHIIKNQRGYYEELLSYSRQHLMMFPYHLSDVVVMGLRTTPFQYYISILTDIMEAERSYDSLPNFTAADCLRLLGIGRNQYIDLMNQCRSSRKLFRRRNVRDLLPQLPLEIPIEPWWLVCPGCVTEDDIKSMVRDEEKQVIDHLIDNGQQCAGSLEKQCVQKLYSKGLIYLDVPISNTERLAVPPLERFVMNRVLGDYLENLMYKIFISIDEHTPVQELAKVLEIDLDLVKVAVSLFCRLGFAQRKTDSGDAPPDYHESWQSSATNLITSTEDRLLLELESALVETDYPSYDAIPCVLSPSTQGKRIAFLYDSTLTAFLMMGNLSPGLKSHAVTMFEVGKMLDEGLDNLISELDKIQRSDSEGEAQRYFEHALTLRTSITFLRHNPQLREASEKDEEDVGQVLGLDLIRWESLSNLNPATAARLLNKNYQFLVSMAPLSYEVPAVEGEVPPHWGPHIPEVNSVWFKLFLYDLTHCGPTSLLLPKGDRLRRLPECLSGYEKVLVTPWGHDPTVVPLPALFTTVNEALMHSPVFIQAYGWYHDVCIHHIPLPLDPTDDWSKHTAVQQLVSDLQLHHTFGFIKLVAFPASQRVSSSSTEISTGVPSSIAADTRVPGVIPVTEDKTNNSKDNFSERDSSDTTTPGDDTLLPPLHEWQLLECHFGLPLFDASLNKEVSRRIIAHKLFSSPNVEKFISSSEDMVKKLRLFIINNKARNCTHESNLRNKSEGSSSLPLPTTSLLFYEGTLTPWGGS